MKPTKLRLTVFLFAFTALAACTSAAPGATPSRGTATVPPAGLATSTPAFEPSPTATATSPTQPPVVATETDLTELQIGLIPTPPDRDLYDLARRLTLQTDLPVSRFASPPPEPFREGMSYEWRVNRADGNVTVSAVVRHVSEHAYWLFEEGFEPDQGRLTEAARRFETEVWPSVISSLGDVWNPGIDNDPRIVIFHGELRPGVAGYFSGIDEYPVQIQPDSNQREAIYVSANAVTLGGSGYMGTIAHELQHAIHWAADAGEESWVNEGLAEVASGLAGIPPGSITSFLNRPNTSLVQWEPEIFQASPNYGAAALFFEYMAAHYGGPQTLRAIVDHPEDGLASVDSVMSEMGFPQTSIDLFGDWVVANFVDDESGPFAHPDRETDRPRAENIQAPDSVTGSVRPLGTNYYVIEDADNGLDLQFRGVPTGRLFPAVPHSGQTCWWSNAGDSINTTLTRSVDLREVEQATFKFWAWYAIEEDWDYAYIDVSTDGGSTWQILASDRASFANPNGTAFGPGLTGQSPGWVQDEVSLSRYAGSEILLRLEYITDDAIHDRGACFDDFSIPEIGWSDDTENAGKWIAEGFALVNDRIPVDYLVQVIRDAQDGPSTVERLDIDDEGIGEISVAAPGDGEQLIVAVSVTTPGVTGSLNYSIGFDTR